MQKLQILFPDPTMDALRRLARAEDRDIAQRSGLLGREVSVSPAFPTFDGGKVLVSSAAMKSLIQGDELR